MTVAIIVLAVLLVLTNATWAFFYKFIDQPAAVNACVRATKTERARCLSFAERLGAESIARRIRSGEPPAPLHPVLVPTPVFDGRYEPGDSQ